MKRAALERVYKYHREKRSRKERKTRRGTRNTKRRETGGRKTNQGDRREGKEVVRETPKMHTHKRRAISGKNMEDKSLLFN